VEQLDRLNGKSDLDLGSARGGAAVSTCQIPVIALFTSLHDGVAAGLEALLDL
jgi:hypothetical protein